LHKNSKGSKVTLASEHHIEKALNIKGKFSLVPKDQTMMAYRRSAGKDPYILNPALHGA
jgi:hypothetical protein